MVKASQSPRDLTALDLYAGLKGSLPAALSVPGMLRAAEALVSRSDSGHASSLGSRPSAEAAAAPDAPLPAGAPSQQQGCAGLANVSPKTLVEAAFTARVPVCMSWVEVGWMARCLVSAESIPKYVP